MLELIVIKIADKAYLVHEYHLSVNGVAQDDAVFHEVIGRHGVIQENPIRKSSLFPTTSGRIRPPQDSQEYTLL